MHKTLILLLLMCLHHGHSRAIPPASTSVSATQESKGEKLQIEGTVRNVDEWKLPHKADNNDNKGKFNVYWTRLNWGARAIDDDWQTQREPLQSDWKKEEAQTGAQGYENHEPVRGTVAHKNGELINSEVELIDPSKVSEQLANLKFMRYEKHEAQKDI